MSNALPPIPQDPIEENFKWRDWFRNLGNYIQQAQYGTIVWPITQGGTGASTAAGARNNLGLGTVAVQNSDNVAITGGVIDNTPIGSTIPSTGDFTDVTADTVTATDTITDNLRTNTLTGYLYGNGSGSDVTASPTIPWEDIVDEPYLEAAETSATITLTATPQVLKPTTTVAATNINYDSSTGVFTFPIAGTYSQLIAVNAVASTANQYVYIYAENWNGSTWVVNTNSGKQQVLINNNITQVVLPNPVRRTAGQQVRYMIYSNGTNVQLQTTTLPGTTAIVPAIRIQYAG
jgi:hypothetical protein